MWATDPGIPGVRVVSGWHEEDKLSAGCLVSQCRPGRSTSALLRVGLGEKICRTGSFFDPPLKGRGEHFGLPFRQQTPTLPH